MSVVKTVCFGCGKECEKTTSEFNRNLKRGRKNFCGGSCSSKTMKNLKQHLAVGRIENLQIGSKRDEYSRFRMFINIAKTRQRENPNKVIEIDLKYLKELWDKQNGTCPYTGWKLVIAESTNAKDQPARLPNRASLDRIDSSKGYIVGNVQYVAMIYQFCKNNWTDADVLHFAKSVANNS